MRSVITFALGLLVIAVIVASAHIIVHKVSDVIGHESFECYTIPRCWGIRYQHTVN